MSDIPKAIYDALMQRAQFLRFGIVAVIGLSVDLGVAWVLAQVWAVPLPIAATVGFLCGAVLNYGMHELWTFQDRSGRLSLKRLFAYLLSLWFVLAVRLGGIAVLGWLLPDYTFLILIAATGLSFCANYIVSKSLIFRSAEGPDDNERN
ncbi:MAG: GtrA family protein [Sedimentitalea sp.]|uniref:GtrA family protein n=1 Tax=Sedimentitalea sp. TaxID=2048915 RepID=UPI00326469B8